MALPGIPCVAQVPAFEQALALGDPNVASESQVRKAVTDKLGNLYVTGIFRGRLALGATTLTAVGDYDVFVAKLDAAGTYQWAAQAGGNGWDISSGLAVDTRGNVHITGYSIGNGARFGALPLFTPTHLFDGMGYNLFVATLSPAGQWQRAVRAGGSDINNYVLGRSVALDAQGNAYVTGQFLGQEARFGSTVLVNGGGYNLFVACLDAAGTWRWAVRGGGPQGSTGNSVAADASGGVFLTGHYEGRDAFLGGVALANPGNGRNAFVAKLAASSGALQWVQQIASFGEDVSIGLATDGRGDAYVTGGLGGGPATIGTLALANANPDANLFVAKFDGQAGTCRWATRGGRGAVGTDIVVNEDGSSYVSGTFSGEAVDFGATRLRSAGLSDGVVALLDAAGTWRWALSSGGAGDDYTSSVAADGAGGAYVVGTFQSSTAVFGSTTVAAGKPLSTNYSAHGFLARATDLTLRSTAADLTLWPNPARGGAPVWATGLSEGQPVRVFDAVGRLVVADARPIYEFQGLALPATLRSGVYVVRSGQQSRRLVLLD